MAISTLVFGLLLAALAAYGYFAADPESRSLTALIPLAVGLPLIICGAVALKELYRKHAMHVAAGVAALGTLASGGHGLRGLIKLTTSESAVNSRALTMVLVMFGLCAVFLALCVKSFIDARRRQRAETV